MVRRLAQRAWLRPEGGRRAGETGEGRRTNSTDKFFPRVKVRTVYCTTTMIIYFRNIPSTRKQNVMMDHVECCQLKVIRGVAKVLERRRAARVMNQCVLGLMYNLRVRGYRVRRRRLQ